jgi:hypothetical protein
MGRLSSRERAGRKRSLRRAVEFEGPGKLVSEIVVQRTDWRGYETLEELRV